jgi:hypothetical protein
MDNTNALPVHTPDAEVPIAAPAKAKPARKPRIVKTKNADAAKVATAAPVKAKPKLTKSVGAEPAKPPKEKPSHYHLEHGVKPTLYTGLSSYLNDNRKAEPRELPEMSPSKLSERSIKALTALREAYGQRQFRVKGFDNNIIAFLRASKLIELSGGTTSMDGNYRRFVDGATPLMGKITAAGAKFGLATK